MAKNKSLMRANVQDIFVSVVVVAKSDVVDLAKYIKNLSNVLSTNYTNYEIIIIDNAATKSEIESVTNLLNELPAIRIIKLSQQFKYDTALFAGIEVSIGDYVCTLDASLDPVAEVPLIITKNHSVDVVQGVSKTSAKGFFGMQLGRRLFYWYNRKYIGIDIPLNATYFASYSRRAVNSLTSFGHRHRYVRHLARRVGYGYETYLYTPLQNPSSQRTLKTGIAEAFEIVTSYSTHPLRFVTGLGAIAGFLNVLYAFYVVIVNVFNPHVAQGWTSTSMQLSLMFFILFTIMVVLSEYIGRILTESKSESSYFIADELVSSTALVDTKRRNITK